MMSIARSGDVICTVVRRSAQCCLTAASDGTGVGGAHPLDQGAGSGVAVRLTQQEGQFDRFAGVQGQAALQGGAGVECRAGGAGQGAACGSPAGAARLPPGPMNSARSAVRLAVPAPKSAKATRPGKAVLNVFCARIAPVAGSVRVTMKGAVAPRAVPSTHSA